MGSGSGYIYNDANPGFVNETNTNEYWMNRYELMLLFSKWGRGDDTGGPGLLTYITNGAITFQRHLLVKSKTARQFSMSLRDARHVNPNLETKKSNRKNGRNHDMDKVLCKLDKTVSFILKVLQSAIGKWLVSAV